MSITVRLLSRLLLLLALSPALLAQASVPGRDDGASMSIEEYDPISTLVVPEHPVARARFPFIDVHGHQWAMPTQDLDALLAEMDVLNMGAMVNLSGRVKDSEAHLLGSLENVRKNGRGRLAIFTNVSWDGIDQPGWGQAMADRVAADVAAGAVGLKIYKDLGLSARDGQGRRIAVDDPRIDPVWARCGELGVPVLIHTGEPVAFWSPKDRFNERWLELWEKPERYRDPDTNPSWQQLSLEQQNLFARHRSTTFIAAHMAWMANDLDRLGFMLEANPNVFTEIGAVLYELGRQPRHARAWFVRWQDRVMFGKDLWAPEEFPVYFRVLETADESFDYYRKRHASWKMYGLELPDDVLAKLYYGNALGLIRGLDASLYPPLPAPLPTPQPLPAKVAPGGR